MRRIVSLITVLLFSAIPTFAAGRFELEGWASWVNTNSTTAFNSSAPNQPFGMSLHNKIGYGAGVNIFWTDSISTDFSVVEVRPSSRFVSTANGAVISGPNLRMTPITALLQFHFMPKGFIDPYVGGGAAYVLLDNISGPGSLGVSKIDFKKDVGLALNGGIQFGITPNFAIVADGKYVPVHSSTTAVYSTGPNSTTKLKINPAIFSAGLAYRF
jgi:outer membrane protein W